MAKLVFVDKGEGNYVLSVEDAKGRGAQVYITVAPDSTVPAAIAEIQRCIPNLLTCIQAYNDLVTSQEGG